jgi:ribosomal protein L4
MVARKATLGKMPISQLKRLRAASKNPAERAMITEVIQSIDNKTMGDRLDKMQGDPKYMARKAASKAKTKNFRQAKTGSPMMSEGGLTQPTKNQTGLKKLPTAVRNKMGFFKSGGMAPSGNNDMRKGGMFK